MSREWLATLRLSKKRSASSAGLGLDYTEGFRGENPRQQHQVFNDLSHPDGTQQNQEHSAPAKL